jgi:Tfp pilus assembly PilM family ATPase
MAFGKAGVLGVEVGSGRLRVVRGAVSGPSLRIYDFAAEDILVANSENIAQQLEALVSRRGFRSFPAALTISGPGVVHRLLEYPIMPMKELNAVVARDIGAVGGVGQRDVLFDWEVTEESVSGNLKQLRVLVAMAPKDQVDTALNLLSQCRLKPALITTPPVSLLRVLRFVEGGEIGLRIFLNLSGQQGYLLGIRDGVWSFYREFSSRSSEGGMSALVAEATREANRALLYFRQQSHEGRAIDFLLGGENGLEEVKTRLQNEIRTEGAIVNPALSLDLDPLEERVKIFRDLFPSFVIPLGLVAAASVKTGINLVPKQARSRVIRWPMVNVSFVRRPVSVMLIMLVLIGLHLFLVRTGRSYERLFGERTTLYDQWLPAIRAAQESQPLYESQILLEQSLGLKAIREPSWVVLFKTMSDLVPPGLVLQSMSVRKADGNWLIGVKGEVVSTNGYKAQIAFNRFYRGLKSSLRMEKIELLPLNISTFEEASTESDADPQQEEVKVKKTKVQFELSGQMKGI